MRIELSTQAKKFLEKVSEKNKTLIVRKIGEFKRDIEKSGIIPFKTYDVKTLQGEWHPYKRLRIGKYRIIFTIDIVDNLMRIIIIDNRGSAY